jgi:hypothetical protein
MTTLQLEMSFNSAATFRPGIQRRHRLTRARWWFDRMRAVVSCARDWPPAPLPRPEQKDLALPGRRW